MTKEEANKLKEDIKNIRDNPLYNMVSKDTILEIVLEKIDMLAESGKRRMNEQWQELKETIIELRDNNGTCTQQEVCKFLANLMDVLEKQMSGSENEKDVCKDCYYNDEEVHAECVICDKTESGKESEE